MSWCRRLWRIRRGATSADRVSAARRSRAQLASWLRLKQLSANVWKGTVGISLLRKKAPGRTPGAVITMCEAVSAVYWLAAVYIRLNRSPSPNSLM